MKRRIRWGRTALAAAVLLVVLLLAGLMIREQRESGEAALLQELNAAYATLSAQPDFTRMKAEGEWVRLYLTDGTEQAVSLPVDILPRFGLPWGHPFRLSGGWKTGDDVFFITGGAVDDCWGYVISEDEEVSLEGLNVLRRIGGNAWYFSTIAE